MKGFKKERKKSRYKEEEEGINQVSTRQETRKKEREYKEHLLYLMGALTLIKPCLLVIIWAFCTLKLVTLE